MEGLNITFAEDIIAVDDVLPTCAVSTTMATLSVILSIGLELTCDYVP